MKQVTAEYKAHVERQMRELLEPIISITWIGKGSVDVVFETPPKLNMGEWNTRFFPFLFMWDTRHSQGVYPIRLFIPAVIRKSAEQESQ